MRHPDGMNMREKMAELAKMGYTCEAGSHTWRVGKGHDSISFNGEFFYDAINKAYEWEDGCRKKQVELSLTRSEHSYLLTALQNTRNMSWKSDKCAESIDTILEQVGEF